jgi:O-glycosyl hydrolase
MKLNKIVICGLLLIGCSANQSNPDPTPVKTSSSIEIDLSQKFQTIHHFGASDAWTCQFVGKWPDEKRNQVADWLFSTQMDAQGKPKGIGLSMWRFNVGAGSAVNADISDEWRRTEGFLNNDGSYDWNKQAGERWFLQAAKDRGVGKFLAFTNSPPIQMTENGKAFSSVGTRANIGTANYLRFGKFLSDVVKHLQNDEKIKIDYLSPFNEPQWDWTGNGQEGTPYTNQEVYDITNKLDSIITAENIPVKIAVGEAGKLNYLYEDADKIGRGNQLESFFNQSSSKYLGNFSSVEKVISGHSYFTSAPIETVISTRKNLKNKLSTVSVPVDFWQSEYCILGDQEEVKGAGKDLGMVPALYIARLIHNDLTVANASAWNWWLAVSAYDYKDGLIYVEKNKTNGTIEDSRMLWAMGNYSRFVRPGAVRVAATGNESNINNPTGLMVSSFVHEQDKKLVVVILNYGFEEESVNLSIKGGAMSSFIPYVTSSVDGDELKPQNTVKTGEPLKIPKRSIVTLVSDL